MSADRTPSALPPVSTRDMWLMILSTVRYALGRSTYIVSEACRLVHAYRPYLTQYQVVQLEKEVARALEQAQMAGEHVGMKQDHVTWTHFVEELRRS